MKNIFTGIFLLVSACFMQAQTPNYYRNPDKIYLDSKEGHNGSFTWQMHKADETKDPAEKISQPGYQTGKWMSAIVPGTVLNSLVHNKMYPEPYYGMNNKLDRNIIPDLAKTGREFYTYWFRTEFDVPENYKDKIVWLQVDGINYRAEIWVNGYLLGNMSGMFKPEYINITDFARIGQKNALAIKVYPVDMPGTIKPKQWGAAGEFHNGGDGNIGLNTTMLMSVGWDFTFNDGIRDRNTGIWKNISLYATDKAVIRHPFIKSELSKPNYDLAKETVSVEVTNPTQRGIKCTVKGEIIGENITFSKDLNLFRGETKEICFTPEEFPQLTIKNPRLWWPIFKGNPELYELKLTVSIDGKVSDETKTRFGIREITSDQNTPDKSRQFYVNGKKLFIRGTNWIPEGMLRTSDERTYAELRYTKQSGINLIRMWGGGIAESDYFFQLCDEMGLLVWQEFWMTGDTKHPQDKDLYLSNVEATVKRLRNHLIINSPEIKTPHRCEQIVEFVDLYPTMCDAAGIERPAQLEGTSLLPLLKSPEAKTKGYGVSRWANGFTFIQDQYFYTEWRDKDERIIERMLFDHSNDGDENYNVAGKEENKAIIEELSKKLLENRGDNYEK